MKWGPARGRSSCLCPDPHAPGVGGEAEETSGQRLGWEGCGGVSPTGACSGVWPPRGARCRWRGRVRCLECVSETHRQASSAHGSGGAGPVTTSRAASLMVPPWGSARDLVPCRQPCPAERPGSLWPRAGLCLLQALVAVDGPCVDLGGGVLAEVWGEQSPQQSRRGRSSAWARCFREREPEDSASWSRRLRGACPLGGILLCHSRGPAVPASPGRWP